jgi:hypothetical protein
LPPVSSTNNLKNGVSQAGNSSVQVKTISYINNVPGGRKVSKKGFQPPWGAGNSSNLDDEFEALLGGKASIEDNKIDDGFLLNINNNRASKPSLQTTIVT